MTMTMTMTMTTTTTMMLKMMRPAFALKRLPVRVAWQPMQARGVHHSVPQLATRTKVHPHAFREEVFRQQRRFQGNYRRPNPRSGGGSGGGGGGSSSFFGADLLYRWVSSPRFYRDCAVLGLGGAGFYAYNLEEVPVSGRRRFNWVPASIERQQGEALYREIVGQYRGRFLPDWDPRVRTVAQVLERLVPHSGLAGEQNNWEVHVIDEPGNINAFVIPGGKVFVFSGILDICKDQDGVAAVLGHEIAHNVAHHAAEQMSTYVIFLPLALYAFVNGGDVAYSVTKILTDLMFLKPGSRQHETEADYIGLKACFDPKAAIAIWERMEGLGQGEPHQFLSTHPSNHNRMAKLQEWLQAAEEKRENSGCGHTASWAQDFRESYHFA